MKVRLAYIKKWQSENLDKKHAYQKTWRDNNLSQVNAGSARRRARKRNAIPSWYCAWMVNEIYDNCPEGMEVDHIQPLASGGLHSHENLQYLTVTENRSKGDSERGR